ncbi:MAG TPA: fused MFS/spermidine synthase [Candidatus Dormibacteraeota bacterium]|nr:fused MFS/spermidine synthase [Candidatus Dormibacteraeota bacterium]
MARQGRPAGRPREALEDAATGHRPPAAALRSAGLVVVCFVAGAALMIVELTGYRVLAPVFGNSLWTWTALIGIILIAFSAGSYIGGRLGDWRPDPAVLAAMLAGAAILVVLIPRLMGWLAGYADGLGILGGPVLLTTALFMLPGMLLGAVPPFALRLHSLLAADRQVGGSAGMIGMAGSLGSFVGTFATGFVLLARFGVTAILSGTGAVLFALAAAMAIASRRASARRLIAWAGAFAAASALGAGSTAAPPPDARLLYRKDGFYQRIEVAEYERHGRVARMLLLDGRAEGGVLLTARSLPLPYQNAYRLLAGVPGYEIATALFIGGGAFGMPERVAETWPDARVDVVEVDPEVVRIGYAYFDLAAHPGVRPRVADARMFLRTTRERYDLIFGDAYSGLRRMPAHLTSREFFALVRTRLRPHGIFMMNTMSALRGDRAALLSALAATLGAVFADVRALPLSPDTPDEPQNVILIAGGEPLDRFLAAAGGDDDFAARLRAAAFDPRRPEPPPVVLSDDFNPIDAIVARQLW